MRFSFCSGFSICGSLGKISTASPQTCKKLKGSKKWSTSRKWNTEVSINYSRKLVSWYPFDSLKNRIRFDINFSQNSILFLLWAIVFFLHIFSRHFERLPGAVFRKAENACFFNFMLVDFSNGRFCWQWRDIQELKCI